MATVCGTGTWSGPLPGDPDNNISLSAESCFGGVRVSWTFPLVNPFAVAHVNVYRATVLDFSTAIPIAKTHANGYFDPNETQNTYNYYYWINVVSVNGTSNSVVGPAFAQSKPTVQSVIQLMTGQIDDGMLAQSLKTEIGKVSLLGVDIQQEIQNRITANINLGLSVTDVQTDVENAVVLLRDEINQRITDNSAVVESINLVAIGTSEATAAIATVESAKIGYAVLVGTATPFDGDGVTIVYPALTYPSIDYPEYAENRTRIIDKHGVTVWNTTPAGILKPAAWLVGLPLATAVKQVGVVGPDGQFATVEQAFTAQKGLNDEYKGMYTAKVDVNGLIGGFGIYNDGDVVEAGFDVDKFWIGRTTNKTKPFIIVDNEVFINEAVINQLTVDKLRTATGGVVIQDGTIRLDMIDYGWSNVTGAGKPADGATRNVAKGEWASGVSYVLGDNVLNGGYGWECIFVHVSTALIKPPTYPVTSNAYWILANVGGVNGVDGVDGKDGINAQTVVKAFSFTRANSAVAPSGGSFSSPNPTTIDWSDGVPPDNNLPLWMTTRIFTSDGLSPHQTVWSTPAKIGTPSTGSKVQFSVNGSSSWHDTPATNDYYMRSGTSTDNGSTWAYSGAVKIKGEIGVSGQGQVKGVSFIRATSTSAPSGGSFASPNATTANWSDGIPADNNLPLWMSTRIFTSDGASPQQSVWTAPAKVGTPSTGTRSVFSVDGSTLWHVTPAVSDVYMATQTSTDNGVTWGAATGSVKIKGETGLQGTQGTQGTQGIQGIQGATGANGVTYYTWIKYADSSTTGMSDFPSGKEYIGIAYNQITPTESTNYGDYAWSLIQGTQGIQGVQGPQGIQGLLDVDTSYILGTNGGLRTGTIALNPTTGAVSGSGVAVTGRGIAAANNGTSTFSIVGSTGAATFSGTVAGGNFISGVLSSYNWPAYNAGTLGSYLGPEGLLVGNANAYNYAVTNSLTKVGKGYFQITNTGDIYSPGFSVVDGKMTIVELNVIGRLNIQNRSVTIPKAAYTAASLAGTATMVNNMCVQAVSITSLGSEILINAGVCCRVPYTGTGYLTLYFCGGGAAPTIGAALNLTGYTSLLTIQLQAPASNGVGLEHLDVMVMPPMMHTPGAGTWWYALASPTQTISTSNRYTTNTRSITLLEVMK